MRRRKTKASSGNGGNGYIVGYGKPPAHGQFQQGQSGNPSGRRKGVRNLKTDVKRALATLVKVKAGGRTRKKSTQEIALMVLCEKALRGDVRANEHLIELAMRFNNDMAEVGPAAPLPAEDQAILDAYVAECIAAGATAETINPPPEPTEEPPAGAGEKVQK